jgi:hypothetical protein
MMNRKTAVSITLIGLFAANVAYALPGFDSEAPMSSVETCVAEVSNNVNHADATSIEHNVETEERRVSGHKMRIKTFVYGDGDTVIREYAASCAINDQKEIKRFNIRQKGE